MQKREGYEVIRFIERGDFCHASLDYVNGITLYDWVTSHREIEKENLYTWIRELLCQLVLFHRQRGTPDYGKLSPYTIIIMRKGKIALLSGNEKNASGDINKYFIPPDSMQNIDVYCFGKIIQFIMAHVQCEPGLSKIEEYKLQKLVKKCLETNPKKKYENIHMVQANFMKTKKLKVDRKNYLIVVTCIFGIGILGMVSGKQVLGKDTKVRTENKRELEKNTLTSEDKEDRSYKDEAEKELFLQTGIDYFLENEEYEKSLEYLKMADIQEDRTRYYLKLAEFMAGDKSSTDIQRLEDELEQGDFEKTDWGIKENLAMMRTYEQINSEEYIRKIEEVVKKEETVREKEELSDKLQYEYIKYQALLYEESEQWNEAADCYDLLCEIVQKEQEELQNVIRKSLENEVKYLEVLWEDIDLNEEKKLEKIKKAVAQKPEMMKNEEFIRFINERKIYIEEGKVWVETMKKPEKREDAG